MGYAIVFKHINRSYSGYGDIPSPGRVFGALLNSAYRLGKADVIDAVRALAHAPQPEICTNAVIAPVKIENFSAGNPQLDGASNEIGKLKETRIPGASGGNIGVTRRHRCLPEDAFTAYWVKDSNNRSLIEQAVHGVGFLGQGHDIVVGFVQDTMPLETGVVSFKFLYETHHVSPSATDMRMWSPELLATYDRRHEAIMDGKSPVVSEKDIRYGRWGITTSSASGVVILPLNQRLRQRYAYKALKSIQVEGNDAPAFLTIDNRGFIRGIGIPYDENTSIEIHDDSLLLLTNESALTVNRDNYWTRRSSRWISATPVIGHFDPNVIVWQAAEQGLSVTRIEKEPFHHSQGELKNTLPVEKPYQRWWLEVTGKAEGIIRLGDFQDAGAGLFRPLTQGGNTQ